MSLLRAVAVAALLLSAGRALADPLPQDAQEPVVVLAVDLPVTAAALGVWGLTSLLENRIGPKHCRWCETTTSLNAFDRLGRHAFSGASLHGAATASDIIAYGLVPAVAFGLDFAAIAESRRPHSGRRFLVDALLIGESVSTAMTFTQLVKFSAARRRPDKLGLPASTTIPTVDEDLSFFSGHTTLVFSLATSAGTLCSLRHERLAPLVWAVGISAAAVTGMLRVAGDRHYASDVITASVVGSAVGVVVPVLHRLRSPVAVGGSGWSQGGLLTISGLLR